MVCIVAGSSSRRDAATSTRDGCAPQTRDEAVHDFRGVNGVERLEGAGFHTVIRRIERGEADLRRLQLAEGADGEVRDDRVGVGDKW